MTSLPDYKNLNDALYPLNMCDNPDADILFFHGVVLKDYGKMYKETWMTGTGELWPAAWLPMETELSGARMFSVKYDSSVKRAADRGRFDMKTLVESLAANLIELNSESIGQRGIPVILVGHDLGGIVIKELCLYLVKEISLGKNKGIRSYDRYSSTTNATIPKYKSFLESLAGLFYFATPHQGLELVPDGMQLEGDLPRNLEILNADTAKSNNDFRKLRQMREWMARGVGPALKDREEFLHIKEASLRYDTDEFLMVLTESNSSITKPKSRKSSSFQFFAQSMKEFITAFRKSDLRAEEDDPLRGTVGLKEVVEEIMVELSRQQEANAGTSAVVLHGMGGIGKSTLGTALYRTLIDRPRRRVFLTNSRCHLDRQVTGGNFPRVTQLQSILLKRLDQHNFPADEPSSHGRELLMKCYKDKKLMGIPLLIFLDNIEDERELSELLPGHIGKCLPRASHLIVATRNAKLCTTLRFMGLPNAMLHEMKELDPLTGQRLLIMHAFGNGEVESPLSRVPVPWTVVEEVTEACGCLPLALEVVGTYLRSEEGPLDSRKKWREATKLLGKLVTGSLQLESRLQKCLEFSYNKLTKNEQRSLLDIVLCFNGSPWREVFTMYGHELHVLKRRALIKEGTLIAGDQGTYQYVKVHSLLESLCREKGKRSHFFKSIDGSHINFDDIPSHQDKVALVLEGRLSLESNSSIITPTHWGSLRLLLLVLALLWGPHKATYTRFFVPDKQPVKVQSRPISHLMRASPSLRILILKNLRVIGTFADDNLPLHLKCLVCSYSTVPFTEGNVANLRELKFVDFYNTIGNRTFKVGQGVKRLRLGSPFVETLRFEDGDCDLEELALVSGRNFQACSPNSKFSKLRKLIIRDVPSLLSVVNTMQALESLSIHGCDQLTELAVDLRFLKNLRHFHISLENLRRLPDTLCSTTSLQTLILEDCFSLDHLPNDIGCIPTLEAVGIKGCSKHPSTYLPGSLRTAFQITSHSRFEAPETTDSTAFNVIEFGRNKWLVCSRKNVEGIAKLIQEAVTTTQMPAIMLKPIAAAELEQGILQQPQPPPTRRWESSLEALATEGAQPGNQSPSGEIDHIAPSTSQRRDTLDIVERTGSDELKLLSAQLDTMSITPMDRSSTQQELSVLSNTSLRRDIREIRFHHEFDPRRVVCICEVSDDAVQILFLHVEGMATLFGVGLPYSLVALREEDEVEIKQLPQQDWTDSWSKSNFSLVLLDCSSAVSDSAPRNAGQRQALSPEDAAKQYGVGLMGSGGGDQKNYFTFGAISAPGISLSWIASLRNRLISSCRDGRKGKGTTDPAVPLSSNSGSGRGNNAMDPAAPSSSGSDQFATPHEDYRHSQGQVTTTESGVQNQPPSRHLQLTVRIRLDEKRCKIYNKTAASSSLSPNQIPAELKEFWMNPNVTIRFQYDTDYEGIGTKNMRTTLEVNFSNDSACTINQNVDKFGWYHDMLRLSFKSTGPESAQVTREGRKEDEIISRHSIRSEPRESGRETSASSSVGKESDVDVGVGNKYVGHMRFLRRWNKETTVGSKENRGSSPRQELVCLDGMNFSIIPVDKGPELAHLASMYPPLGSYDLWDDTDRSTVSQTGIMGTVQICTKGDWEIDQEANDLCQYNFSCQRELNELQRSTTIENERRKSISRRIFPFSKPRKNQGKRITSKKLEQRLVCGFMINHSFSHMQRLQRPQTYLWNMVVTPSPVIDMVSLPEGQGLGVSL